MLGRFRDEFVLPYLDILRHFSPLGACLRWGRECAERVAERSPA